MLYKWVREQIAKYSFVEKTVFVSSRFLIFYKKEGVLKHKSLPYRATREQVARCIDSIKKEVGYAGWRKREDMRIIGEVKKSKNEDIVFAFSEK